MRQMNVSEFSKKIAESGVVILDVRTAEEIAEGYIEGAQFEDFYGEDFKIKIEFRLIRPVNFVTICVVRKGLANDI